MVPSVMDPTRQIASYHDAELAKFFARPVRIFSGTWEQASAFNQLIDPWALFFADPRVINRVTHFSLARCSLCVKFILSGNPFLYGQLMASYMPYPVETSTSAAINDGRNPHGTGVPTELVLASQRHKVLLTPMMSEGACMRLPFFNKNNWFQTQINDWVNFGNISIQVINQLKHANAGTEGVSVNIFAWAEDMELSVPTSTPAFGLVAQAGMDEYVGSVSRPASILSRAIARARNVPTLGPYAMATSVAAGAVSGAAAALGYSRPPALGSAMPMSVDPFTNFASTDAPDLSSKLTVDSKQGVTIDTRVMGLAGEDELGILRMAQVESYLTTFTWPVSQAADSLLFSMPVTPMLYSHWGAVPSATVVAPTALAAASFPFAKWRGTVKIRFQIICTPYHKGRLRVLYDPYAQASLTKFNVNYTKIVDLSEENDFEMCVSWADDKMVLAVDTPNFVAGTNNPWSTTAAYTPSQLYDNGVLSVVVMNALTAPNDTINNDIGINVFVRAGDDFELYEPDAYKMSGICMVPQAGYDLDSSIEELSIGEPTDGTDLAKVVIGERIVSFRQLLKRYVHYTSGIHTSLGVPVTYCLTNFRDFPVGPGTDPDGLYTSVGLGGKVNVVSLTLLTYLASMFVGYRGALRYKHFEMSQKAGLPGDNLLTVFRLNRPTTSTLPTIYVSTVVSTIAHALDSIVKHANSFAGCAVAKRNGKSVVEVELPYYSPNRFELVRPLRRKATSGLSHQLLSDCLAINNAEETVSWVSVGEDFTYGYFVGANLWYQYYLVV